MNTVFGSIFTAASGGRRVFGRIFTDLFREFYRYKQSDLYLYPSRMGFEEFSVVLNGDEGAVSHGLTSAGGWCADNSPQD